METAGQWERIKMLFHRALELPAEERASFLARETEDETLRRQVETLLASHEDEPDFLEGSAAMDAAVLLHDPMIGRSVGVYRIVSEIAHGGMGTVYLAERTDAFRKRIALKIVKRGMDTDEVIRRFRYERQVLASLDHPNIARIIDGGATDDGLPYLVMDYVEGEAVDRYCERHQLSIAARLSLFLAVCDAVAYAHRALVIHRDLKPTNILVGANGAPVLLDFGIAKVLDPSFAGGTAASTALGMGPMTPQYASPEQLCGQPVTTSSDVYSLGVILYELLTGKRLVQLDAITPESIRRIAETEAPLPSSSVAALRGDLDRIVLHALEKDPARRYSSVEQFAADIRRHQQGLPVLACPSGWVYRAGKFVRRHRAGVAVAVALTVIVIGAAVLTLQQKRIAEDQRKIATDAAHEMVFQVSDAMSRMSGPTEARLRLLARAGAIFDRLKGREGTDRDLDVQIAETNRSMAAAYFTLGDASRAAERVRAAERALMPYAGASDARTDELSTYGNVEILQGDILIALQHPKEGIASYDRAIDALGRAAARPDARIAVRSTHALAVTRKADRFYEEGKFADADPLYRRALAIDEAIVKSIPRNAISMSRYGTTQERLADSLYYAGRVEESCVAYRKTLDLRRNAAALDPGSADLQLPLAISLQNCGFCAEGQGNVAEAAKLYEEGVDVQRKLLQADPGNQTIVSNLMGGLGQLGSLHGRKGDWARSLALLEEADRVAAAHRAKYGPVPRIVNASANNALVLGETLAKAKRFGEARRALESSLRDFESLHRNDPANLEVFRSVVWAEQSIASLLRQQSDLSRALPRAVRAVERAREAARAGQSHDAQELARALHGLALTRLDAGDPAGALAAIDEGLEILNDLRARGQLSAQSPGASEYLPQLEKLQAQVRGR